jgi:NAD(P)H-dependent flavin oxidoreductase YrpB (nitropropane dioxygenase family)
MIGTKYPILLGAFAGYDNSKLTGVISDAGALGVLTASAYKSEKEFLDAINSVKSITTKPFGVNFSSPEDIKSGHIFYYFLEIASKNGIKTIITAASRIQGFGNHIKDLGLNWFHKVTTMKHAISGQEMGADAVILTGLEGGGLKNPKQNTLLINLENAKNYINVPLIASGGISTGKSVLAALILGADAVHICTAFLATEESPISPIWKQRIIETDSFDPDFIQKVCHFETTGPKYTDMSMSVGTISEIVSAKTLIENIIDEAEKKLKGFKNIQ